MKVSIIGSRGYPLIYSGYETLIKEISERLVKKCEVTVYCHIGLFKIRPKKINNINLIYTPSVKSKIFSQIINSFFSTIHACFSDADIILYVNVSNGPFTILTKIFNKKTLVNVDGMEWQRPKWKGLGSVYFKFGAKLASKFSDMLITDCDQMRITYLKLFNVDSKVIAYGPNRDNYEISSIFKKLNIKKNNYFLVIGRLIPDNNADLILNEFIKSKTSKKLVIVGDVPYKDNYASQIKKTKNKKVLFTGYISCRAELADLYKNCYVYIHGHEFGGTNPTLINALNYGCAIFAHDNRFNREVLRNSEYGLYFKKHEGSLINLINSYDDNTLYIETMKKKAKNGVTKKYDWDNIVELYYKIFNSLMEKLD